MKLFKNAIEGCLMFFLRERKNVNGWKIEMTHNQPTHLLIN